MASKYALRQWREYSRQSLQNGRGSLTSRIPNSPVRVWLRESLAALEVKYVSELSDDDANRLFDVLAWLFPLSYRRLVEMGEAELS